MRGVLLQSLKDLVGEWADVYTAQLFQYNGKFNSIYGYPAGFGAVGNFNDHHFHYGYFLRAAAAIGRYDRAWLDKYLPLIDELRRDVAGLNRSSTRYPFLREFNPYQGHSWANGTGDGGNNEESTSEAINFAVGLIELGDILGRPSWRDMGLYLYESEILTAEQYWFNQDADRTKPVPVPPIGIIYNGNWPEQYVTYVGPDGLPWHVTTVGIFSQFELDRGTFFGGIDSTFAIQQTPLGASDLYLGRNQVWLADNWQQFVRETTIAVTNGQPLSGTNEVIAAAMQARLPDSTSTDIDDTGLIPALKRINKVHNFYEGAVNAVGKYFAYTLAQIGQIDASVVANTPEYGVFNKAGVRTYVAYNPTASPLTVTFKPRASNTTLTTLTVPPRALASKTGNSGAPVVDNLTPAAADPSRLYLHGGLTGGTLPSDCLGTLDGTPGTFTVANGQTAFPPDLSALNSALAVVPKRTDGGNPDVVPPPAEFRCWAGTFKGNLVSEGAKATRMNIFTDKSLFPGWQENHDTAGNALTMRVQYFFDASHTTADRVEFFQNLALNVGNAFEFENKITEFYFDQVFGLNLTPNGPGPNPVLLRPDAPFPDAVSNGKIIVQIYGGSGVPNPGPVPVAIGWDPLTDRASWIKPPYEAP